MTPAQEVPGILRPSGADIRQHCAGSFALQLLYPEDAESPKAREGTAAHFYATEAVLGRVHPVGTLAPNGHPIDAEMIEGGTVFVEDIVACQTALASVTSPGPPWAFGVETKLTMHERIHPDCEGTPDAYLLDLHARALYVWDYKYGHGYVDPYRNAQLLEYCAGVFEAYELTDEDVAPLLVSIRIVQPRNYDEAGPVRRWDTTGEEVLRELARLRAAEHAAKRPGAPTQTGDHCRYCDALHACRAAQAVGMLGVDLSGSSIPRDLPPAAAGLFLRKLTAASQRLEALRDALTEQVSSQVRNGAPDTGFAIEAAPGREFWDVDLPTLLATGDAMGVDLRKKPEAITPAQARKAGLDASVTTVYAKRKTAMKLVERNDDRAARIFGGVS
jgi:hypothetical protein